MHLMHIIHGRLKAAIDVYIPAAHWHEVCGAGAPIEPLHQLAYLGVTCHVDKSAHSLAQIVPQRQYGDHPLLVLRLRLQLHVYLFSNILRINPSASHC